MAEFNDRRSSRAIESPVLSSLWTGLSPHLIAKFFAVDRKGLVLDDSEPEVHAPISDGNSEMVFQWQSPFEHAGAESKAPILSAMLQSGAVTSVVAALASKNITEAVANDFANGSTEFLKSIEGRTGITRLNSTQVFVGMPPVKLTMTLHFRALRDPVKEVLAPIKQLKSWALPEELADDGLIGNAVRNGGDRRFIESIFPSTVPKMIGMRYGDMLYSPMVIESMSESITTPRTSDGVMQQCSVQITLATLTALDRRDIQKIYAK